ncbi:hypothetical protein [Peribacillus tepidiphilus]|uniref:hypothetical protein n=1 Tax=Peribacillus tepidiphilus TaxID=2652445 RepID=UPI00129231F8|nr:hypothetical protein [Peribacillus tepidiphilus]
MTLDIDRNKKMLPLILLFIAGYYLWLLLFQGHDWIKKIGGDAISIISIGIGAYLLFRTCGFSPVPLLPQESRTLRSNQPTFFYQRFSFPEPM